MIIIPIFIYLIFHVSFRNIFWLHARRV